MVSVLESVGGDQDRAVDTLLGMSDPEHISTAVPEQPAAASQTDLDEQFARQLMLEEEERFSRRQARATGEAWQPRSAQQEQDRARGQASPPRDTMAEVTDQFSKIAESGKRTFSSLMSKVKAKVQEFDQSRTQGQSGSSEGTQPTWGAPYGAPQPGLDRHAQQAFYAPRVDPSQRQAPTAPSTAPGVAGHDFVNDPTPRDTPPPPSTTAGPPPIDPSKVGLLPKRPVSLLDTNTSNRGPPHDDDDDDELEYVENPFEERRH
ncbi:hypothetical protein OF83DRAFT_885852 [Amylostereum chailletii]|nr:hypothetical protein OF83DRAFT_885852 [Amylostereum chailletii]